MALANIAEITPRVVNLLLLGADDAVYPSTVDTETSNAYSDDELSSAILKADAEVCLAYIETDGHPQRVRFLSSHAAVHGAALPAFLGELSGMEIQTATGIWVIGKEPPSLDLALRIIQYPTAYPTNSITNRYWWVENGVFYTTGLSGRFQGADFTGTGDCQAHETESNAVIAGALAFLFKKDGDPSQHAWYSAQYDERLLRVRSKAGVIPDVVAYKKQG